MFSGIITHVKEELYVWITDTLAERGWKDADLARRARLSSATISLVMSGQRSATADFCIAIAQALDADVLDVLRLAGHLPPSIDELRAADPDFDRACRMVVQLPQTDQSFIYRIVEALALRKAAPGVPEELHQLMGDVYDMTDEKFEDFQEQLRRFRERGRGEDI